MEKNSSWAIGIIIGWFSQKLFLGVFYELGYIIGEWIGSVFQLEKFKLVTLKTIR